jgi:rare lipoprotein A (peptidoglycan hydrolase)
MDERIARRPSAGTDNRATRDRGRNARPDRMALWAVFLALFALAAAAVSAHASAGGGTIYSGGAVTPDSAQFGSRVLTTGMHGSDVQILNGIVKSKPYASGVQLTDLFKAPTASAVKRFQGDAGLPSDGVVGPATSSALVRSMPRAGATWYGPGFYGRRTACGQTLTTTTLGVANKSLPCGTKVTLAYHGHYAIARVIDRGPYAAGYTFDLTSATAKALGFAGSGDLRFSVAHRGSDARLP